ncbi:MAG: SCO family protein [Hyphomicrobiales bacterium]
MTQRILLSLTICVLAVTIGVVGYILFDRATQTTTLAGDGLVVTASDLGGGFTLMDESGAAATEKMFKGKYALVYFGYSFCPDVCPTGLQMISAGIDKAGTKGENVVPVFISVDPDRDTPDQLKQYTALFHDRMEGLTGTKEQIDSLAKKFRVYYALRKDQDPNNYPVDHSSFAYLMDDNWNIVAVFRHEVTPDQIAKVLNQVL